MRDKFLCFEVNFLCIMSVSEYFCLLPDPSMEKMSRSRKKNVNRERVKANRAVRKVQVHPVRRKRSVVVQVAQITAVILSNDHR